MQVNLFYPKSYAKLQFEQMFSYEKDNGSEDNQNFRSKKPTKPALNSLVSNSLITNFGPSRTDIVGGTSNTASFVETQLHF